jgi:hydrogenase maturation protein HypF
MRLEALARPFADAAGEGLPFAAQAAAIDPAPAFAALAEALDRGDPPGLIAARFHRGLARAVAAPAAALVAQGAARAVALTGGCYQNPLLLRETVAALGDVPVLLHGEVPANDGGLALGQAAVAMARLASG